MKKHKIMRVILPVVSIGAGIASYIWYNTIFLRMGEGKGITEFLNPAPYVVHFDAQQDNPASFFTASMFPEYAKRCHDKQKFCQIMPMQQLYADFQWLGSIQFVGGRGGREDMTGLGTLLDNVTNIAPYWHYPYAFGQLLIPIPQKASQGTGDEQDRLLSQESRNVASSLAKKAEYYTCDPQKIHAIRALSQEDFVTAVYSTGEEKTQYTNPCPSYERPHYTAFNKFYYENDAEEAAQNYKISAFHEGAPGLTPMMAALVYGRAGKHLKSATLRYDRYIHITQEGVQDDIMEKEAERALKKAVFELQLQLITDAAGFAEKNNECMYDYLCLVKKGYIRQSITHTTQNICNAENDSAHNVRCILVAVGLHMGWIHTTGGLIYPVEDGYDFSRDDTYKSRWITLK